MDIKKLAPWNWFKKEDEETGSVVPVQISGHLVLHRGLGLGGDIADQFQQPADPFPEFVGADLGFTLEFGLLQYFHEFGQMGGSASCPQIFLNTIIKYRQSDRITLFQ